MDRRGEAPAAHPGTTGSLNAGGPFETGCTLRDAPPGGAAAVAATSLPGQVKDLAQRLAVAAQVFEEHSGAGSCSGEGRDVVSEGLKSEEELGKSAAGLCSSGNLSDLTRSGSGSGSGSASASGSAHSDSGQALQDGVETSHAAQVRYLEEQLKASRMKQLQSDQERHDLIDKIVALEAKLDFNSVRFEMDLEADGDDLNGDTLGTGFIPSKQSMPTHAYMRGSTAVAASWNASQSKSAGGGGSRGSGSALRGSLGHSSVKPQPRKLMIIEEENDVSSNSGSENASGAVSSDDCDAAADQEDLKDQDTHDRAQTELRPQQSREERRSHHVFNAETAENDARLHAKSLRLQQLAASCEGATENVSEDEPAMLKHSSMDGPARHAAELEMTQLQLVRAEQRLSDQQRGHETERKIAMDSAAQCTMELQDLRDQYNYAVEAKKIAERRLEDFKREMEACKSRHTVIVADLTKPLRLGGSEEDTKSTCSTERTGRLRASEMEMEKQREMSCEEERGVLINRLEWKEVQWKGQLDNIELQHTAEVGQLKKQYDHEVTRLRAEFQDLTDRQKDASARTSSNKSPNGWPAEQQSLLAMLRCPKRLLHASYSIMQSSGAGEAAYCQEVCWKVVLSMPGIVAILCGTSDLQIIEASKKACSVWVSSQQFGHSLLSLLAHKSDADWLKRACEAHQELADLEQRGAPGFLMRELGCLEFQSKAGNTCNLSVLMVHLPEEPRTGKQKAVIVILKPMGDSSEGRDRYADDNNFAERCRRRCGGQSGYSDVSEDVMPSDSASQVIG